MKTVRGIAIALGVSALLVLDFFLPPKAAARAVAKPAPPGKDTVTAQQPGISLVSFIQKLRKPFSALHPATPRQYVVKTGDCLYWIGQRFGIPWQRIYRDNRSRIGADPNLIYSGTVLTLIGATQDQASAVGAGPAEGDTDNQVQTSASPIDPNVSVNNPAPPPPGPRAGLNPLRGVHGLVWERVDMGQDFSGTGPVYAINTGVILEIWGSGWPGGGYILEHLTTGPHAGSYVYFAEDITPSVHIGQIVDEHTQIGYLNGQMEVGWGTSVPEQTLSAAHGTYSFDGKVTPEGLSFSAFLKTLNGKPLPVHHHHNSVSVVAGADNLLTIAKWLHAHGYSAAAAAGITSCIDGESGGNPESVGSGGGGLIGWTPLVSGGRNYNPQVTGNATADLISQLQGVLSYNNQFGGSGAIAHLNAETNPIQAAWDYSANFEHPAVTGSDVVDQVATQMFAALGG